MYITTTQLQLFYEIEYIGSTLKINEQFKKIILLFRLLFSLSDSMIQKRSCVFSAQSSLSIFTQKYLCKCRDIYLMLQNKYLCIYKDSLTHGPWSLVILFRQIEIVLKDSTAFGYVTKSL